MIKLPETFSAGLHYGSDSLPTKILTPDELGFPTKDLAKVVKELAKLDTAAAAEEIAKWLRGDIPKASDYEREILQKRVVLLAHLALTDDVWAATRAVIEASKDLHYAYLAYGIGILGLEALPRLIAAHDAKGISKQAKWQYRHAIVAALAVAASRGETWGVEHDRFLAVDQSWWFPRAIYLLGNWHNDLMLGSQVTPLLRIAIAHLPKQRAHAILDAALDETGPKKFPMCFFALPLLKSHWRAEYLERAITATRLGEDGNTKGFIDSEVWRWFVDDLHELGLIDKVVLERYKTGHSRHQFELNFLADDKKALARAKKLLPATQLRRFQANYNELYS